MLFATVSRGKNLGTRLLPHRFKDDRFHVRLGKHGPYIPITDYRDIPSILANGYSLEMSNKAEKHNPSLMLIDDADKPAKWYFALKQARLEGGSSSQASDGAKHPLDGPVELHWRS